MSEEKTRTGYKWVQTHFRGETSNSEPTLLEVQLFDGPVAHINVEYGLTVNLGDCEFAKVTVGVELPCYPEETGKAFEEGFKRCKDEIKEKLAKIKRSVKH